MTIAKPTTDVSKLEAGVLREVDLLLRELKGARATLRVTPESLLEKELGLGSLERVELLSRLEKRFRVKVSESALSEALTPRGVAEAFVHSEVEPSFEREAVTYRPSRHAPPEQAQTLGEVLMARARAEPDAAHVFMKEDGKPESTLTLGELYSEALTIAGGLSAFGIERDDKVALMLPTSRDFLTSFMGVLLAGAVPVPLYPPFSTAGLQEYARRQAGIIANAEVVLFITLERGLAVGDVLKTHARSLRDVVTTSELVARSQPLAPVNVDADATALIQYTSGSTGDPKGVELTHANLLANIRVIGTTLDIQPSDVGVSWLPLYHDMGLIGAWLAPLYFGMPVSIFSPLAFLARPERWLWTIHARRATISPAPNFAYERCVRKIAEEDLEGLDLSSWRVALNGAEPIAPETLAAFQRKLAPYGFREESFLPVYGLAESSLLLASSKQGTAPRIGSFARERLEKEGTASPAPADDPSGLRLVSVGSVVPGHEIRIVDEGGRDVPEGREGSLIFRGPSVMKGYYKKEEATAAIRRGGGYLDSGDRAFELDGELFITGRSKDIIIRAGRNLMPQEIEKEIAEVDGVRRGCIVAFGVSDAATGTEKLVVVAESREDDPEARARIGRAIESRLLERTGVPADDVRLVPPRSIPKTSSGKLRRSACREQYLRGELASDSNSSWTFWARALWFSGKARVKRELTRFGRVLFGCYVWVLSAFFVLFGWGLTWLVPTRRFFARFVRYAARVYLLLSGIRLEVEGSEHLSEAEGPFVFVANHASYLDPIPVMASLPNDYAFVVKSEAASWPFFGRFIGKLGHLPVKRSLADESAKSTDEMRELLDQGRSVVLFPEGTFSYATGLRPFKLGAFKLAAESGRPLVPIALVGTRRWLRDGTWMPRPGRVAVVIGEPRTIADSSFEGIVQSKEETAEIIAAAVGEPRLDLVSAGPLNP